MEPAYKNYLLKSGDIFEYLLGPSVLKHPAVVQDNSGKGVFRLFWSEAIAGIFNDNLWVAGTRPFGMTSQHIFRFKVLGEKDFQCVRLIRSVRKVSQICGCTLLMCLQITVAIISRAGSMTFHHY